MGFAQPAPPVVTPQAALNKALESLRLADGEYLAGFTVNLKTGEEMMRGRRSLDSSEGPDYLPDRRYWNVVFDIKNTKGSRTTALGCRSTARPAFWFLMLQRRDARRLRNDVQREKS
jgi:hypothetical protein